MPPRRVLLLAVLLFLIAALIGAAARPRTDQAVAPAPGSLPERAAPSVTGTFPAKRPIVAHVGDFVTITVTPKQPDTVAFEDLGVSTDASAEVPGVLEVVADQPGRFSAVEEGTGKRLGTLVVEPAR